MRPGAGGKVDFPLFYEKIDPLAAGQSAVPTHLAYLDVQRDVVRLFRIPRLQVLNSLLAVTETHDHLEDVVTHGSLQVRHDKLRNRIMMASIMMVPL